MVADLRIFSPIILVGAANNKDIWKCEVKKKSDALNISYPDLDIVFLSALTLDSFYQLMLITLTPASQPWEMGLFPALTSLNI